LVPDDRACAKLSGLIATGGVDDRWPSLGWAAWDRVVVARSRAGRASGARLDGIGLPYRRRRLIALAITLGIATGILTSNWLLLPEIRL